MSDIAAVIARLLERDLRERWDEDILALIAAYEAEKQLAEDWFVTFHDQRKTLEEQTARAERAEQDAAKWRELTEDIRVAHEQALRGEGREWHEVMDEAAAEHDATDVARGARLAEARKHIEALLIAHELVGPEADLPNIPCPCDACDDARAFLARTEPRSG